MINFDPNHLRTGRIEWAKIFCHFIVEYFVVSIIPVIMSLPKCSFNTASIFIYYSKVQNILKEYYNLKVIQHNHSWQFWIILIALCDFKVSDKYFDVAHFIVYKFVCPKIPYPPRPSPSLRHVIDE